MPIYAYKCATCGHADDVIQKMSDNALTTCPKCGAETYTKQITAAGFALKGSGWYVTDFRGGNTGAPKAAVDGADAANAKPDANADSKTDAKSDIKPDTKLDTKSDSATDKKSGTGTPASGTDAKSPPPTTAGSKATATPPAPASKPSSPDAKS